MFFATRWAKVSRPVLALGNGTLLALAAAARAGGVMGKAALPGTFTLGKAPLGGDRAAAAALRHLPPAFPVP